MDYVRCSRCIMTDKGDPYFSLDENGNCNYCSEALLRKNKCYFPNETGEEKLNKLISHLKEKNRKKQYDCIMGISGGLDSSYLAYLGAAKWGLRIKAIHIDDGFDTEIAKENVTRLCEAADIDIEYICPDEKQFCELTRAYLFAGVPNLAIPQDNIFLSALYEYMRKYDVKDYLSGYNYSMENILQKGNTWDSQDKTNIKAINKIYGREKIDNLPVQSLLTRKLYRWLKLCNQYAPLDYIDYNKDQAISELKDFCGFSYYQAKHLENYFTGFLQLYWLPRKFNVDKRTSHLSSLIISGQMSREEALEELDKQPYSDEWMDKAISLIKQKCDISDKEFDSIMSAPVHQHTDFQVDFFKRMKRAVLK